MRTTSMRRAQSSSSAGGDGDNSNSTLPQPVPRLPPPEPRYSCVPCLDRPSRHIRAIVHGSRRSPFWIRARSAAMQAARDAGGIDLTFDMYDEFDAEKMADDVTEVAVAAERANERRKEGGGGGGGGVAGNDDDDAPDPPEALVLTIPSTSVARAAERAARAGVPIFGLNSGYDLAAGPDGMVARGTLLGFWAMDEYRGGYDAATTLWRMYAENGRRGQEQGGNAAAAAAAAAAADEHKLHVNQAEGEPPLPPLVVERALFVNGEHGNTALDDRGRGFSDALHALVDSSASDGTLPPSYPGLTVDTMIVDALDEGASFRLIQERLGEGCRYQAVLIANGRLQKPALAAMDLHRCHRSSPADVTGSGSGGRRSAADPGPPRTLLGAFDTSAYAHAQLHLGRLALAVSQQQHLQASLPVLHASLFATTGFLPPPPTDTDGGGAGGVYLTGPRIFTASDALSDTEQSCENESHPVCPHDAPLFGDDGATAAKGKCPCVDRSKVRIGGVVHGVSTDAFWDSVFAASHRAASDLGVVLDMRRFPPQDDEATLHAKMSYRILGLCRGGAVDGVFASVPSAIVEEAVRACLELDVPVVTVNAGFDASERWGLAHHVGQIERAAGWAAGRRLVESGGGIDVAYCLDHARGVSVTRERCEGFEAALNETGTRYGGKVYVPHDNNALFVQRVEEAVEATAGGQRDGDWEGTAFLMLGVNSQLDAVLEVQRLHPKLKAGTFDVSNDLYPALDDGRILFGMDQQEYLQGYLPVPLLTYMASSRERLLNHDIETGPRFVVSSPSAARQACQANTFEVCPQTSGEDFSFIDDGYRITGIALFAVQASLSVACIAWTYRERRKMIVRVSQPEFLVLIAFGSLVLGSSILPTLVQAAYRYVQNPLTGQLTDVPDENVRRADAACMAFPWLAGVGFVLVFSALFAKILRVKKVYDGAMRFSREKVTVKDTAAVMVAMMVVEVTILLSWQLISPLRWEREVLEVDENGFPTKSVGMCTSEHYLGFLVTFLAFKGVCLVYGLFLCYVTRNVPSVLSEGKWISFAVLSMFQTVLLAVPVLIIIDDNTDAFFFVRAAVVFLVSFSVTGLIFFPKAYVVRFSRQRSFGDSLNFSRGRPSVNLRTTQLAISTGNIFTDTACASCTKSCATQDMSLVCDTCKANAKLCMSDRMSRRNMAMMDATQTTELSKLTRSVGEEKENGPENGTSGGLPQCGCDVQDKGAQIDAAAGDVEYAVKLSVIDSCLMKTQSHEDVFPSQSEGKEAHVNTSNGTSSSDRVISFSTYLEANDPSEPSEAQPSVPLGEENGKIAGEDGSPGAATSAELSRQRQQSVTFDSDSVEDWKNDQDL